MITTSSPRHGWLLLGLLLLLKPSKQRMLKPLLQGLGLSHLFDAVIVSAEVGAEKPNPVIFQAAVQQLGVDCEDVLHIGDDRRNDLWGARDAGRGRKWRGWMHWCGVDGCTGVVWI
jgi:phosphoglycolate phosphatase-like HAD superfamily hydrolase